MSHGRGVVCATLALSSLVLASTVPPARTIAFPALVAPILPTP
jgi:hypothetical protein